MAFVTDTIAQIMLQGKLTRKQAKVVFNSHRHAGPNHAYVGLGVSRQVARKIKREGGSRRSMVGYWFTNKYKPHQGKQEIARRLAQG